MPINIKLDEQMKKRGITNDELARKIGITPANLSNLRTGKTTSIRFELMNKLCEILGCQPGDLFEYKQIKKVIPLFLDYSGTTDNLLKAGAENVKGFFEAIKKLQRKTNTEVQITMVTGSSVESAKGKLVSLNNLAINDGLPNLFDGAVAEYCGYIINSNHEVKPILPFDTRLIEHREELEKLAEPLGGSINPSVTSYYNFVFPDNIKRDTLDKFSHEAEQLVGLPDIETLYFHDNAGKECDVKPKKHTKYEAVYLLYQMLSQKYDIPFIVIGGDSQEEDLKMYTHNRDRIQIPSYFIAPQNIGKISTIDNHVIIGDKWTNYQGIVQALLEFTQRIKPDGKGGFEIYE